MKGLLVSTILFEDDFNDNSLDSSKWTADRDYVTEDNREMQIYCNKTDAGGRLFSLPFGPLNGEPMTITRRVFLHYENTYAIPRLRFQINGENVFKIHYANMSYNSASHQSCHGVYISKGEGNPHSRETDPQAISSPVSAIWDEWYDEKIIFDPETGTVSYYTNDELKIEYDIGSPASMIGLSPTLEIDAWGWWTGHYHFFDDLVISQATTE